MQLNAFLMTFITHILSYLSSIFKLMGPRRPTALHFRQCKQVCEGIGRPHTPGLEPAVTPEGEYSGAAIDLTRTLGSFSP